MRSNPYILENLRQGAFHYLLGRGAAGIAGLLSILLLVRFMDLSNYAAYTALSGLVAICGVLGSLGIERALSRYIPEARLNQTAKELENFILLTSAFRLASALFIVMLLFIFWPTVDRLLAVAEFEAFPIALACFIIAESMFQHFSSVLQSLAMQKALTRLLVIQWAVRLLLILIIIMTKSGINWRDSLWIFSIPEMIGIICFAFVIWQHLRALKSEYHVVPKGNWPLWPNVIKFSLHNYGFTLLATPPQGYFLKVLAAVYLPVEVVAAYGFFLSLAEKARQYIPLHFFYGLLEPMMIASYLKDRNFSALSYRCQLLYKSNLILMVPAIVWVIVAGDSIVELLAGGKFMGLSWILVLVMVQLTIGSHVVLLQLLLNSLDKSKHLVSASMAALPVMLLAMLISIITIPLWLLVTPLLFSLVMNFYIITRLAQSDYHYKPSWKMLGGVMLSGSVALSVAEASKLMLSSQITPIAMVIVALLGIVSVYLLSLWLSKSIDEYEINLVKGIVRTIQPSREGDVEPILSRANMNLPTVSSNALGGRALINELQAKARSVLDALIPQGSSVALLDYPNNSNVGDSLIWLGEIAYLSSRGIAPCYVCDLHNYEQNHLQSILQSKSTILLHGGGNFGTMWPHEHAFRIKVLSDFTGVPIIQLPQSLFFDDDIILEETAQAIRRHGNFTLIVRDQTSYDFAIAHFECRVFLCPDMAFFIGPLDANQSATFERFILSRTDHEKSSDWLVNLPKHSEDISVSQSDWLDQEPVEKILNRIQRSKIWSLPFHGMRNSALLKIWNMLARARLARGRALLECGNVVISDRLHVHILCILLDKPHVLIDNSYRKLSNFHQAWTTKYLGVRFATNLESSLEASNNLGQKDDLESILGKFSHV
jgi:exopolysaccharide biosynthesis predicted pyruvyltransferase EpsI/O-antigen/teichoic acid export membrane protein